MAGNMCLLYRITGGKGGFFLCKFEHPDFTVLLRKRDFAFYGPGIELRSWSESDRRKRQFIGPFVSGAANGLMAGRESHLR